MSSAIGLVKRLYTAFYPPVATPLPDSKPIKFGILGAANIAPIGLISPAKNHPEAVVVAVAARDKQKVTAFAKKHGIEKVYGGSNGYQELLDDPEVEAVYNPLPNGLHYEWTMKALAAGKHVLLEKPSADTAEETREMFDFAEQKGLVLLEAVHYRFHPAIQRVKAIIDSKELGALKHLSATLALPAGIMKEDDIRFNYALGGGALMDMGCYTLSCIRYLSGSNPISVLDAKHELHTPSSAPSTFTPDCDRASVATLQLPNDVTASLKADLAMPWALGIKPSLPQVRAVAELEGGKIELLNFVGPTFYHHIKVTTKGEKGKNKTRTEKAYTFADGKMEGKGEAWWTTYRYQLEAFIDRLKGRTPQTWVDREDSIANMQAIELVYNKTGLGSRPRSQFVW